MTIPARPTGATIDETWTDAVTDELNGIVTGSTSATTDASGDITISFGVTFAAAPIFLATPQFGTTGQVALHLPSAATTTQQVVRVSRNDAAVVSTAVTIKWVAIGVLA